VNQTPSIGDFVEMRGRRWLVEGSDELGGGLGALRSACIDGDAQGEPLRVSWGAELDGRVLDQDAWAALARDGTDDPTVFAAYLRTIEGTTATAAVASYSKRHFEPASGLTPTSWCRCVRRCNSQG
jgi:hypothetical protein